MGEFFRKLFSAEFMPHGHCFYWRPEILWLHVGSDALIALSYFSIPLTLLYFARRRTDLVFPQVFLLFGMFIFACGTTHLFGIWTMWNPTYRAEGIVKLLTGLISATTAVFLIPVVPRALALRSPSELQKTNRQLNDEIERRRQAESELRHQRDHVQLLLDLAPVPVVETDAAGVVVQANRYAETLAGATSDELVGTAFAARFRTSDGGAPQPLRDEAESVALPAGERLIDWRNRPIGTDDADSARLWVGVDVTDRVAAEHLRSEKERIATAGRMRRDFLARISQEMRDPIDVVFGYAEVLAETPLSAGQRELVDKMVHAKRRVSRLVDDLLDLSAIEIGQLEVLPRRVDGVAAVRRAAQRLQALGADDRLEIAAGEDEAAFVRADPERLEQIFANLFENALRIARGGKVRVSVTTAVSTEGTAEPPNEWRVVVQHPGPRISASRLLEYLEDLAPLSAGTQQLEGGGLGLAISKQLVDRMKGRIWADGDGSGGSALVVAFPLDDTPGAD